MTPLPPITTTLTRHPLWALSGRFPLCRREPPRAANGSREDSRRSVSSAGHGVEADEAVKSGVVDAQRRLLDVVHPAVESKPSGTDGAGNGGVGHEVCDPVKNVFLDDPAKLTPWIGVERPTPGDGRHQPPEPVFELRTRFDAKQAVECGRDAA